MDNPIRFLFQQLTERIFGLIARSIGRTVSLSSTIYEAEQQSALEDLARRYEADGKPFLAEQLRTAAKDIAQQDPAHEGAELYQRLSAEAPATLSLPEISSDTAKPRRPRRSRRSTPDIDEGTADHGATDV